MNDRLADALDEITNRCIMRMVEKDARIAELEAEIKAMKPVVEAAIFWVNFAYSSDQDLIDVTNEYTRKTGRSL